jgi:hypothetical protein
MSKAELDQWEAHGYLDAKSRGDRYSAADGVERAVRDFLVYVSARRFRSRVARSPRRQDATDI